MPKNWKDQLKVCTKFYLGEKLKTLKLIPIILILVLNSGCKYLEPDENTELNVTKHFIVKDRDLGNYKVNDVVSGIIKVTFNFDSLKTKIRRVDFLLNGVTFEWVQNGSFNHSVTINTENYKDGINVISANVYLDDSDLGLGNLDQFKHHSINLPLIFSNKVPSAVSLIEYSWVNKHPKISWQKAETYGFKYYEIHRFDFKKNINLIDKIYNIDSTTFTDMKMEQIYSPYLTGYFVYVVNNIGQSGINNSISLSWGNFINTQSQIKFTKPFGGGNLVAYNQNDWGSLQSIDYKTNAIVYSGSLINIFNSYWTTVSGLSFNVVGDSVGILFSNQYNTCFYYSASVGNMQLGFNFTLTPSLNFLENLTSSRLLVEKGNKWEVVQKSDFSSISSLNFPTSNTTGNPMLPIGRFSISEFIFMQLGNGSKFNIYKLSFGDQNNLQLKQENEFPIQGDIDNRYYIKSSLSNDFLAISLGNRVVIFDSNSFQYMFEVNANTSVGLDSEVNVSDIEIQSNYLFVGINKHRFSDNYGEYFVEKWSLNSNQLLETYKFLKPVSAISSNGMNSKIYIVSDNKTLILEN